MSKNKRNAERTLTLGQVADQGFGTKDELQYKNEQLKSENDALQSHLENALVQTSDDGMVFRSFTLSKIGLNQKEFRQRFKSGEIHEGDWYDLGQLLFKVNESTQWLLGDWICLTDFFYNKTYQEMAAATGYSETTLYQYKYVAEKVDFSIRIEKLSFGHHQLIAGKSAKEQKKWLTEAAENDWSVAQLRDSIRAEKVTDAPLNPLVDERHKKAFSRIFRALEHGRKTKIEDIEQIETWLGKVKQNHLGSG